VPQTDICWRRPSDRARFIKVKKVSSGAGDMANVVARYRAGTKTFWSRARRLVGYKHPGFGHACVPILAAHNGAP